IAKVGDAGFRSPEYANERAFLQPSEGADHGIDAVIQDQREVIEARGEPNLEGEIATERYGTESCDTVVIHAARRAVDLQRERRSGLDLQTAGLQDSNLRARREY